MGAARGITMGQAATSPAQAEALEEAVNRNDLSQVSEMMASGVSVSTQCFITMSYFFVYLINKALDVQLTYLVFLIALCCSM